MDLKKYYSDKVKILSNNGKVFIGDVFYYGFADENESGNESIIIETEDGQLVEFEEKDIRTIEILDE